MKDVMIDIETLGRSPGCPVLSVGAVYFDREGNIGKQYHGVMGFNGIALGKADPDTLEFWSNQTPEAISSLLAGYKTPVQVAWELKDFISKDARVWGNGSVFDISILDFWFLKSPWDFWNVRDVRTVVDLFDIDYKKYPFEGIVHNALHDAIHQVKYMTDGIKRGYVAK